MNSIFDIHHIKAAEGLQIYEYIVSHDCLPPNLFYGYKNLETLFRGIIVELANRLSKEKKYRTINSVFLEYSAPKTAHPISVEVESVESETISLRLYYAGQLCEEHLLEAAA